MGKPCQPCVERAGVVMHGMGMQGLGSALGPWTLPGVMGGKTMIALDVARSPEHHTLTMSNIVRV